jgi:hypothetical protein
MVAGQEQQQCPTPFLALSRPSFLLANGRQSPWATWRLPLRVGPRRALHVYCRLGGDGLPQFQTEGHFHADIGIDAHCLGVDPVNRYRPKLHLLTLLQAKLD